MNVYILIILISFCAFLPRFLPWVILANKPLSARMENVLQMAPAAVIAALVFPDIFYIQKDISVELLIDPYFLASIATFIIMLLTKRLIISSLLGVIIYVILRSFL
jgi:branched-subunit amino acid transport protein